MTRPHSEHTVSGRVIDPWALGSPSSFFVSPFDENPVSLDLSSRCDAGTPHDPTGDRNSQSMILDFDPAVRQRSPVLLADSSVDGSSGDIYYVPKRGRGTR